MIYNLLDFRLLVSDANPTLGGDGVFALWALRACSYKPKGETAHQGLSTERHSNRRKQTSALSARDKKSVQIIHKISCPSGQRRFIQKFKKTLRK